MIFKELIESVKYEDIKTILLKNYPDQKKAIKKGAYKTVFDNLLNTPPEHEETNLTIVVDYVTDDSDDFNPYYHVYGIRKEEDCHYALEFSRWALWLGWEVDSQSIEKLGKEQFVANALWEMTFCGFEEEIIQNHFQTNIVDRINEIKEGQ